MKEVNNHWSDNLIPSPSKKDIIFQHVKDPGLHSYLEQPNGVKKHVCLPEAECRSHQCHFMKNTSISCNCTPVAGESIVDDNVML